MYNKRLLDPTDCRNTTANLYYNLFAVVTGDTIILSDSI